MASQQPLTTYLASSCRRSLAQATEHPFLRVAGQGRLSKELLSQWLSQDRIYAQSYVRFIGLLLSKIRLPPHNPDSTKPRMPTAEHRAFDVLTDALVNIRAELHFFEDTAAAYGLDLTALSPEDGGQVSSTHRDDGKSTSSTALKTVEKGCTVFFGPNRVTRAYVDMFMSAGSSGVTLLEGMAVLWATEFCYLTAWRYAATFVEEAKAKAKASEGEEEDVAADGGALRDRFIPNWSSRQFEEFVGRIRDVVDEMAGQIKGAEEGERLRGKCLEWWRQVLWLEERFWPDVEVDY